VSLPFSFDLDKDFAVKDDVVSLPCPFDLARPQAMQPATVKFQKLQQSLSAAATQPPAAARPQAMQPATVKFQKLQQSLSAAATQPPAAARPQEMQPATVGQPQPKKMIIVQPRSILKGKTVKILPSATSTPMKINPVHPSPVSPLPFKDGVKFLVVRGPLSEVNINQK